MAAPWISADPNPVPGGPGRGRTTVSWDTGNGQPGIITVVQDSGPATLFATGARGQGEADWIQDGSRYRFLLHSGVDGQLLAEVTVERAWFDWDAAWETAAPDSLARPHERASRDAQADPAVPGPERTAAIGAPNSGPAASAPRLSRVAAAAGSPLREPLLPEVNRAPTYLDHFDATTLFYDVFHSADGQHVVAIGPPLAPGGGNDARLEFRVERGSRPLAHRLAPGPAVPGSHLPARFEIAAPVGVDRLVVRLGTREWLAPIQPSLAGRFVDRIALVTVSRDNDLRWIADWARFHAVTCGVDAVVLYDNGSTRYAIAEIEEALATVPGIREVAVIDQPVRFGPRLRDIAGDPCGFPDMFLQSAMLRHALDRMLPLARAMLNLDIDELLVLGDGMEFRRWIDRPEPAIEAPRFEVRRPGGVEGSRPARHRDSWLQRTPRTPLPAKWVVRPADLPVGANLGIHAVMDAPSHACLPREAFVAHVREITHRVNEPARMGAPDPGADAGLVPNLPLRRQLERVFGPEDAAG